MGIFNFTINLPQILNGIIGGLIVDLPGETKEGFDYFEFNEAYQITRLVSFFGPLKPVV